MLGRTRAIYPRRLLSAYQPHHIVGHLLTGAAPVDRLHRAAASPTRPDPLAMYEFDARRLQKLDVLRDAGVTPFPHNLRVTHTTAEIVGLIGDRSDEALAEDETEVTFAGRLMFKNEMGKVGFARLQDRSGRLQVFVRKNSLPEGVFNQVWKKLDAGDHVWVRGRMMRTRTGEATVRASEPVSYTHLTLPTTPYV